MSKRTIKNPVSKVATGKKAYKISDFGMTKVAIPKGLSNTGPTEFAIFLGYKNKSILDLGCGNGRDTYFFAKNNKVIGIDPRAPKDKIFFQMRLEDFLKKGVTGVDVVYCRFLLHVISEDIENFIIDWASKNARELAIEVRAKGDVPILFTDHKRRFADPPKLIKKVLAAGFKRLDIRLGYGLAKFGPEDPYILRVTAKHD